MRKLMTTILSTALIALPLATLSAPAEAKTGVHKKHGHKHPAKHKAAKKHSAGRM